MIWNRKLNGMFLFEIKMIIMYKYLFIIENIYNWKKKLKVYNVFKLFFMNFMIKIMILMINSNYFFYYDYF